MIFALGKPATDARKRAQGQVAEWFKAAVLKTAVGCEAALDVMRKKEGN